MTTTIELIEWLKVEADGAKEDDCPVAASYLIEAAQRLRELDEQVKQQINDYGRGMAVADLAIKPDCVWTFDEDQGMYDTGCGEAWVFYQEPRLAEHSVKFCPFCAGQVKEST